MSDRIEDLARNFEENVLREQHPRSIGLFTIPEYPEFEVGHGMWSSALDVLLTTLRYLAPATLLSVFWGQQSFIFKLLKYIDAAFRSIVFSNEEQKQAVLKWLSETSPVEVDHLEAVWQNGWIVCAVLDAAMPGACAGHTPTKLSLKHAQTIADHYLGVEPVFSRQELESIDSLSKHQDWRLATYLDSVRKALAKIDPPKPLTPKPIIENVQFTFDYVARGTGLSAAQVNNKMFFKIFPTAQQILDPGEITVVIRGPNNSRGMTVLPPVLGKAQLIRQKLMGLPSKTSFTENTLPITHGAMYMRSYGKNDMNKTYYIPKMKYDINIDVETKEDQVKVGYKVQYEGNYEISITSRGQNIVGSPFTVKASKNIVSILESESFCLEDGEEIDILDVKTDRKVVLRIVDFVTEKMLLRENGTLEKITEDEARYLMCTDSTDNSDKENGNDRFKTALPKSKKFKTVANRILTLNRVCKKINNSLKEKQLKAIKVIDTLTILTKARNHQEVPDIVNSTLNDNNTNPFEVEDDQEKLIIPENITVSLYTEKARLVDETELNDKQKIQETDYYDFKIPKEVGVEGDNISIDRVTPSSNPFLNDEYDQSYETEKNLGSLVKSEYQSDDSQNEKIECGSIKILIDNFDKPTATNNPFLEPNLMILQRPKTPIEPNLPILERPKTPIYKIITGEVTDRVDSPYCETSTEPAIEEQDTNQFKPHIDAHHKDSDRQLPVADFIIGAPVSLPPMINTSAPEQCVESFIITTELNKNTHLDSAVKSEIEKSSCHTSIFHSLDSNAAENTDDILPLDNISRSESSQSDRNVPSRKDLWDSAYVSIDDNSSSPDTNNNDNIACETACKQTYFNNDGSLEPKREELENMGPAEREIWQFEFKNDNRFEEPRLNKLDVKRTLFTPIIEESDKSLLSNVKDLKIDDIKSETDPVLVAFTELDDMFQEYLSYSETSSTIENKDNIEACREINYQTENVCVDSASECLADVKRHKTKQEGTISEVQQNDTESSSVSQILHSNTYGETYRNTKQFGDSNTNIVLEKKKYWDEKISQIEAARMEEVKAEKKRRSKAKNLRRGDSLTKKKGRQMVQNFLNAGGNQDTSQLIPVNRKNLETDKISQPLVKLVEKWKRYWDDKLVTEKVETDLNIISPQSPERIAIPLTQTPVKVIDGQEKQAIPVIKQELCEEVFKAFETSPKRFFGTSRQQILNKIDSYLGKPNIAKESDESACNASAESGLVSSRVSLFHSMSKNEELVLTKRRCKSMHNISQNEKHDIESGKKSPISQIRVEQKDEVSPLKCKSHQIEKIYQTGSNKFETIPTVEEKRRVFKDTWYKSKSYEETVNKKHQKSINKNSNYYAIDEENAIVRKTSLSKSEMDIFNKTEKQMEEDPNKYKSCEELPKISVKSFITMYENVSKTPTQEITKKKSKEPFISHNTQSCSSVSGLIGTADNKLQNKKEHKNKPQIHFSRERCQSASPKLVLSKYWTNKDLGLHNTETDSGDSIDLEIMGVQDPKKQTTYLSLSDIELEIIENKSEVPIETSVPITTNENLHEEYKSRFKMAKDFFKSLEELTDTKLLSSKINECELLLYNKSTEESPENKRPQKRLKKRMKSNSMPSSDISQIWNQLQNKDKSTDNRLFKISEKFHVEDLYSDIMDGRLSRQGSLRGIPNKKAVLETFRSMENISDNKLSSYEISVSQLNEFAKDKQVKNAQTYLTEYPYLPTTDPSKYHSRIDTKASGLISMKELLKRPRRNSVPDLRLNTSFSADL